MTFDRIICADVLAGLRELPDECVQTVVTSPPYWGLRDYGVAGQIGAEPTIDEYVARLVEVFREVRRVLRDDGTLWLNLGDSYASAWPCHRVNAIGNGSLPNGKREARASNLSGRLKEKDLVGQPWRVAFALQADGWWLRSEIIWHKPNPMPESVTDRPTKSHEQIFLLTKAATYFYDAEAVRERANEITGRKASFRNGGIYTHGRSRDNSGDKTLETHGAGESGTGRNLRSVWTISTQAYPEAHFATFPEAIPKRCILAGTSAKGACAECGAPWEREIVGKNFPDVVLRTTGWRPTCDHGATPVPCLVLDPFAGSGTTLAVAQGLARSYVGIEVNPEYVKLAEKRIGAETPGLSLS